MKRPRSSSPADHKPASTGTLEAAAAAAIYAMRPPRSTVNFEFDASAGPKPTDVAKNFGVSSKVVRDIWNRKTWAYATRHLWCPLEIAASIAEESGVQGDMPVAKVRRRGRPAGARDSVPRRKKSISCSDDDSAAPTPAASSPANSPKPQVHAFRVAQPLVARAPAPVAVKHEVAAAPVGCMSSDSMPANQHDCGMSRGGSEASSTSNSSEEDFEVYQFCRTGSMEMEYADCTRMGPMYGADPEALYSKIEQEDEWMRKLELIHSLEDDSSHWLCA